MNADDKQYVANWLVERLVEDGEMPQIQVQRKVYYTEVVDVPADIAIQGTVAIDEYIRKSNNSYKRGVYWESINDYDVSGTYSLFDDNTGDFLADTE